MQPNQPTKQTNIHTEPSDIKKPGSMLCILEFQLNEIQRKMRHCCWNLMCI